MPLDLFMSQINFIWKVSVLFHLMHVAKKIADLKPFNSKCRQTSEPLLLKF